LRPDAKASVFKTKRPVRTKGDCDDGCPSTNSTARSGSTASWCRPRGADPCAPHGPALRELLFEGERGIWRAVTSRDKAEVTESLRNSRQLFLDFEDPLGAAEIDARQANVGEKRKRTACERLCGGDRLGGSRAARGSRNRPNTIYLAIADWEWPRYIIRPAQSNQGQEA